MYTRTRILVHGLEVYHVLFTGGTGIDHGQKKGQLISWNKDQRPCLLRVYFTESLWTGEMSTMRKARHIKQGF